MYQCVPVDRAELLRQHYPLIEEACARFSAREEREHFAPDVYATLLRGEAKAVLVCKGGEAVGFFAVQATRDSRDRPALQLWIGYARPGSAGAFEHGLRECELLALEEGRATLVFGTQRRGWTRHAPRFGFELAELTFEKQVNP